ncbi:MAG: endolytic transglycosylase MltG [Gammaproteobacteria bacterium]|nr:endolytic transglycosylase MltG [Gammaproteobacteria bacterium]
MRRLLITLLMLCLLAVAGGVAGYAWLERYLDAPMRIDEGGARLDVGSGQSLSALATGLAGREIMTHPRVFARWARWQGADQRIQAGEYLLPAGATPRTLLAMLVQGRVVLHPLTVVEGWRFDEMLAALRAHEAVRDTGMSAAEIMAALGEPDLHPEGLFFPDTYRFARGTSDLDILRQARERMRRQLEDAWSQRAEGLPLASPYEALILASIIEKETGLDAERERVSGVFVRRLRLGMRLQTDPTVIYGLGADFGDRLRRDDLRRDTPYNTYTRHGLPPTPIALAGQRSLRAAVNPADGDELYFVATGRPDGSHYFSVTLEEHNRAVARYLQRMRERRAAAEES